MWYHSYSTRERMGFNMKFQKKIFFQIFKTESTLIFVSVCAKIELSSKEQTKI